MITYGRTGEMTHRLASYAAQLIGNIRVRHRQRQRCLMGLAAVSILAAACGSSSGASSAQIDALIGKRVPGTPATWNPIGKIHDRDIAGTSTGPVTTEHVAGPNANPSITFFEFHNSGAATEFYSKPQTAILLLGENPQPLAGSGPVAAPSRWLDLEQCIYEVGLNPNHDPVGAPSSYMSDSGKCVVGTPKSTGVASITQRGNVVFIVIPQPSYVLSKAIPVNVSAALSKSEVANSTALTNSSLSLLHSVGIS